MDNQIILAFIYNILYINWRCKICFNKIYILFPPNSMQYYKEIKERYYGSKFFSEIKVKVINYIIKGGRVNNNKLQFYGKVFNVLFILLRRQLCHYGAYFTGKWIIKPTNLLNAAVARFISSSFLYLAFLHTKNNDDSFVVVGQKEGCPSFLLERQFYIQE